jgi:hypothetical protein
MDKREIQNIINKHCRFKLRSGKEIFGVMWKKEAESDLYFTTYAELVRAGSKNDFLSGSRVNIEEVLCAEPIED